MDAPTRRVTRRQVLRGLGLLPFGAIIAACGGGSERNVEGEPSAATLPPAATPAPFVVAAGEQRRLLMAGTPQETPLFIFGSGNPGPVLVTLGGVHGNEPGGWLAAERAVESLRPQSGALLVVPRANKLAVGLFERTTPELGDLNRLYPGRLDGLPMERMAYEIVRTLREFHATVLVDLHESWAFYKDRPQSGRAFLGQTVSMRPDGAGIELGRSVVDSINTRIQAPHEELFFREFPSRGSRSRSRSSRSSLGLPRQIGGLVVLLVEMGQQQPLERRVALHFDVLSEVMRRVGIGA